MRRVARDAAPSVALTSVSTVDSRPHCSVGSVASKRGQTATSSERRETAQAKVQQTTDNRTQLEQEILDEVSAIDEKWRAVAESVETVSIRIEATDVRVTDVRLVWVPVD